MRYADPALCPDCRQGIPSEARTCPTCGLLVRHQAAVDLYGTLSQADRLLARLRTLSTEAATAAHSAATDREPVLVGAATAPLAPGPRPAAPQPPRGPGVPPAGGSYPPPAAAPAPQPGLTTMSVPKVLLGLGALCLLVAAVVFLAVSWSWLGVAGRTAVLVTLTATAGGAALWLNRSGLRIAGEALMTIALGVLALDVVGAEASGLISLGDDALFALTGAVVALGAAGAARPEPRPGDRLVAPQIALPLGLLAVYAGTASATGHGLLVGHVATALLGGLALAAHRAGWRPLAVTALVVACLAWTITVLGGLVIALGRPDLASVWLHDGSGWALLVSGALLVAPGAVLRSERLTVPGLAGAAVLATTALTVPVLDAAGPAVPTGTAVLVTVAWALVAARLPASSRVVAVAPAAVGALILTVVTLAGAAVAAVRVLGAGVPLGEAAGVRVADDVAVSTEPLLVVPSVLAVLLLLVVLSGARRGLLEAGAVAAGLGAVVTLASYDVPVAAVVGALGLLAVAATAAGLAHDRRATDRPAAAAQVTLVLTGLGLATLAALAGLPSAALVAAGAAVAVAVAASTAVLAHPGVRVAGGVSLPPALAVLVWMVAEVVEVDAQWRGLGVLVAVGVVALAVPARRSPVAAPPVEIVAVLTGGLAAFSSMVVAVAGGDPAPSLAAHLALAGTLATGTALLHPSRRWCTVPGGALLVLATWVLLADVGVTAPEPYTLPSALALVALGLVHLRRRPGSSTATALTPGLLLATVPSLLWVLDDPISLRAVLLGAACLGLTLAGASLRWAAPLVVGAGVGSVLVLREVLPYAGDVPQWLWLALAGSLLVVVGITWERRLLELSRARGALGRLR